MHLRLFRHLWGLSEPWETLFPKIREAGYVGIETGLPAENDRARFRDLLSAHGFAYIPQIFTGGDDVAEHLAKFRQDVDAAVAMGASLINCHSGSDMFSHEQAVEFYREAVRIEAAAGTPVAHETHRGRVLFHPALSRAVMEAIEDLKLCADFSHWVCVCERLLSRPDQQEALKLAASRTIHVHARVGYEEGPQVPDPRAPEYQRHVDAHEQWWDMVWQSQAQRGFEQSTLTPEFGPPHYMHTLPHTNVPVASLWDICNWQAERQAKRFAELFQS